MTRALRAALAAVLLPVAHPAATALVVITAVVALRDGLGLGLSTAFVVAGLALVAAKLLPGLARPLIRAYRGWSRSVMGVVRALMRPAHGARRGREERPGDAGARVRGADYAA